jgi:hypothetical protein
MGDGKALQNFKDLSLRFREDEEPGDKMMTNMPHYMPLYSGLPAERFVHTGSIPRRQRRISLALLRHVVGWA